MIAVTATQCINCGHVAAPARQLYSCDECGSFEVNIFEADEDLDIEELDAPRLTHTAAAKLLAALAAEERWTTTPLGEGACDTDLF